LLFGRKLNKDIKEKKSKIMNYKRNVKVYINGIFIEDIPANTIVDFPWFVMTYAKQEGIKNFQLKVDGHYVSTDDICDIKVGNIRTVGIKIFDTVRN
jgi:hypothetical protein